MSSGDSSQPVDDQARRTDRQRELGAFLRARRAALTPTDVGLPEGNKRRRVPGLRREEVAQLSGVGVSWYTWLEQGRDIPASAHVMDALARALQLDVDSRAYLRELAELPLPEPDDAPPEILEAAQRMLDGCSPCPGYLLGRRFDFLAWNRAYARVYRPLESLPRDRRNVVWLMFTDQSLRRLLVDWEPRAQALLGSFRAAAGRNAGDPRFTELVAALRDSSAQFSAWWDRYTVREFASAPNVINHPEVGQLTLDLMQMHLVREPTLTVVLQTPASARDREKLLALLS